jgi:hypothetical protein
VTFAHIALGDRRLAVALDVAQEQRFAPGEQAYLAIQPEAVVILSA